MPCIRRTVRLTVVLAVLILVPAGLAHGAPPAPQGSPFSVFGLFEQVVAWFAGWGDRPLAHESGKVDPDAGPAASAGGTIDADRDRGQTSGAACGDAGGMIDPNGGPCGG